MVQTRSGNSTPTPAEKKQNLDVSPSAVNGKRIMRKEPTAPKEFLTELMEIKQDINRMSSSDINDDLQEIIYTNIVLMLIGYAFLTERFNLISIFCLAIYDSVNWSVIAHHTSHGAYMKHDNTGYYHRGKYAIGAYRRFVDWFDVISPEAWNIEHNKLHHYRLNEVHDPDLAIQNTGWLRASSMPYLIKITLVAILASTWKLSYYTWNTYRYYFYDGKDDETTDVKDDGPMSGLSRAVTGPVMSIKYLSSLLFNVVAPYFLYRLLLVPMVFYFIYNNDYEVFMNVLINMLLIEAVCNLITFCIIVPNHTGDDMWYFDTPVAANSAEFYVRAIIGSANYYTGSKATDFLQGYLNYQIEHHMFPDLAPIQLRKIQPRVKALCKKYNIPYVQQTVFQRVKKTVDIMVGATSMINWPNDRI